MTDTFPTGSGYQLNVVSCGRFTRLKISHFVGISMRPDEQKFSIEYEDLKLVLTTLAVGNSTMDDPSEVEGLPFDTEGDSHRLVIVMSDEELRTWLADDLLKGFNLSPEDGDEEEHAARVAARDEALDMLMLHIGAAMAGVTYYRTRRMDAPHS